MPKPLKAPKLKIKEYKDPGYSKYVVVSNPWSQPEKSKLNLFGNTIGGWFETMTGKPVNMVFFESNRDHIIVELDRSVNVEPILGAHHTQDFFRHPGRSHTSEIFEYDYVRYGDPNTILKWASILPNYTRLDLAKLPIKQDYPPPRKPQSSSTKMARRIPQNVMDMIGARRESYDQSSGKTAPTSQEAPASYSSLPSQSTFASTLPPRSSSLARGSAPVAGPSTQPSRPPSSRPLPIEEHLPSVPSGFVPYAPSATFTAMRQRREHEHEIKREVKREVESEGSLGTEHRREQERVRHNDHAQGESYRRDRDPGRASDYHRVGNGHEADADVKPRLSDLDKGFDIPSPRDQANAADGRPPGFGPGHDRESPHLSAASSSQSDSSYPSDSNHPTSSPSSSSFRADLSTRRNESKNQNQSWLSILDSSQPVNAGYQPPEWLGAYSNGLSAFSYQDNLDRDGHEGESSSGQEGATDHHGIDTSSGSGSCDHQSSPANTRSLYQNAKQEPSRVKVEIKAEVGDVLGRRSLYQNAKQELSRVKVEIKAEAEAGDDALGRDAAQDRERYGRYANHRGDERRHQSLSSAVSPPLPGVAVVKVKAEPGDENRNIGSSVPAEGRATSTVTPSTVVTVKLEPGIRVKSEPEDEHGKGLTRPGAFPPRAGHEGWGSQHHLWTSELLKGSASSPASLTVKPEPKDEDTHVTVPQIRPSVLLEGRTTSSYAAMRASLPFIGYGGMDSRVKKEEENGDLGSRFARDKDGQSVGSTFRSPDRRHVDTLTNSAPRPQLTADISADHDDQRRDRHEYEQRFTSSGSVIKKEDDSEKTRRNRAKVEENESQSLRAVKRERDDRGRNLTGYHGDFKRVKTGA